MSKCFRREIHIHEADMKAKFESEGYLLSAAHDESLDNFEIPEAMFKLEDRKIEKSWFVGIDENGR